MTVPCTWQNDPLLVDKESLQLISSNNSLQEEEQEQLTIANPLMNFYNILIRKRDFILGIKQPERKGRILARMPFLPLDYYPELRTLLEQKLWSVAEIARDYYYRSALNDLSVKSWKARLERYLTRQTIPLPIIRIDPDLWQTVQKRVLREKKIIIQSAKGERSTIPLELSEKLVYLLGVIDGDGHLSKHQVHIVDYSKQQIEQLQRFFEELFDVTGLIREGTDGNFCILYVNGKWIVRLIQFLTGHPLGRKYEQLQEPTFLRTPSWEQFRGTYWRGLFDADACYKDGIQFATISTKLINDLKNYFDELFIHYKFTIKDGSYCLYVQSGSRNKLNTAVGSWHPDKKRQLQMLLNRRYNGEEVTFLGIDEKRLDVNGFFDFSLMNNKISILNSGRVIKHLREQNEFTRNEFAQLLGVNYSTLASYENSEATPTIKTMLKIATIVEESLSLILQRYQLNKFAYILSVKLPLSPSNELKEYLSYLYPRLHNYISLQTKDPEILCSIEDFFAIKITNARGNDFKNYVLWDFLQSFALYATEK